MQLGGEAAQRQVNDAHTALVHMMGAGSVCVMHMLQRENG